MQKIRVAINGAGRIGRAFMKVAHERSEIDIVAINDLGDVENIAYLIKHDSVYGKAPFDVTVSTDKKKIILGHDETIFLSEKEPANLPWKDLDIDVVVESTGFFTSCQLLSAYFEKRK